MKKLLNGIKGRWLARKLRQDPSRYQDRCRSEAPRLKSVPLFLALVETGRGDYGTLKKAFEGLELAGPPANGACIHLLNHGLPTVRIGATRVLQSIGDGRAISPLIGRLSDQDELVRAEAATALGEISTRTGRTDMVAPLLEQLKQASGSETRAIVEALSKTADSRAWELMVRILTTGKASKYSLEQAAGGLHYFADKDAVTHLLIDFLERDDVEARVRREWWQVRQGAIRSLAKLGTEEAINCLKRVARSDPEAMLQKTAQEIVDKHHNRGRDAEVKELSSFLFSDEVRLCSQSAAKRLAAVERLSSLGGREAMTTLQVFAKNDPDASVRESAARGAGRIAQQEIMQGRLP